VLRVKYRQTLVCVLRTHPSPCDIRLTEHSRLDVNLQRVVHCTHASRQSLSIPINLNYELLYSYWLQSFVVQASPSKRLNVPTNSTSSLMYSSASKLLFIQLFHVPTLIVIPLKSRLDFFWEFRPASWRPNEEMSVICNTLISWKFLCKSQ